ncbi:glycosyl transferase [Bacteroidia bacterium]|nr:glycosyl transferase [Bacteroidia bacterium]
MNSDFSVLISVYNRENPDHLDLALKSIWDYQTIKPREIVLVKDGKLTPKLDNRIEEFAQNICVKIVSLETNQGLGIALNEGLNHCSYDIVARMDSDDIAKPNRFEKQMQFLKDYPEYDVVGSWIDEFVNETTNIISNRILPKTNDEIFCFAKKRNPLNHPSIMFKKSSVIKAGGYKHFPFFEDYDLWVRMLMQGCRFYNIQESLLYFRSSPDTFKRRGGWKYAKEDLRFQKNLKHINFINTFTYIENIIIRFTVRILSDDIRSFIYRKFIRKSKWG